MPRNKYPEVTEKAILDTAKRLFLEHGYEHVTLQDIAEACGLTRGAIYHHFHGKEEMLDAVTTYMFHETVPCREIQEDTSRNGLEKLQRLIIASRCTACSPGPFTKAPSWSVPTCSAAEPPSSL